MVYLHSQMEASEISRTAAASTILRITNFLMALSLGTQRAQLVQRTAFTWPLLCLQRPPLRRFLVCNYDTIRKRETHVWLAQAIFFQDFCTQKHICLHIFVLFLNYFDIFHNFSTNLFIILLYSLKIYKNIFHHAPFCQSPLAGRKKKKEI